MSVILETTLGNIELFLYTDECPRTCTNFLKLCKTKYYNNCLFFNVQKDFIAQTGDPTGTGKGGSSIYGKLYGDKARFFDDEIKSGFLHSEKGVLAMANAKPNRNGSQFYITLRDSLHYLDKKHTIFGFVSDGLDVLDKINSAYVNPKFRPYVDIRILHTHIISDPFEDPAGLVVPDASPEGNRPSEEIVPVGLTQEEVDKKKNENKSQDEIEHEKMADEIKQHELALQLLGDIPTADLKPPQDVLFVCKLNPVTDDESLEIIFNRFGVKSCEIIRDKKTGDSLCYAFIEFNSQKGAEDAYFKMNNALIDDRRIKVDFSQSVSKLWNRVKRGETVTKDFSFDKDLQNQKNTTNKNSNTSKSQYSSSNNKDHYTKNSSSHDYKHRDSSSSRDHKHRDYSTSYDRKHRDHSSSRDYRRRDRSTSGDRRHRDHSSHRHHY